MRRSKIEFSIVLTVISFILLSANFGLNLNKEILPNHESNESILTDLNSPNQAVNHAPIFIDGDAALATFISNEGLSGNGLEGTPYVIEDFTIDASTAHGIEIRNTIAYLIIQGCTVSGGSSSGYNGIHVYEADNIKLNNNALTGNEYGIYLYLSSNNIISGNNASYNEQSGIHSYNSESITISNNIVNNNEFAGIFLVVTSESTISGNIANYNEAYGIILAGSHNNIFFGNLMIGGGIGLYNCEDNSIDTTNKINEKSVRFYENTNGVHLSGDNDVGQVILINCNDSTIEGIDISDIVIGIMVRNSHNCFLINNSIKAWFNGIYLDSSNGTTLSGNMMTSTGLYLLSSYNNDISITNKVNGKSVRYYENTPSVSLSEESDVGQVILINCDDSLIEGLFIVDTNYGIYVQDSIDCLISDNTIFNTLSGIYLRDSSYNTLSGNILSNNDDAISLSGSNYNTITENIVYNNDYGISLSFSGNNTIYYNDIYGNENDQSASGPMYSENQWDDGTKGNFWGDDYNLQNPGATNDGTFWDTPFSIDGVEFDNFPLVNPIFPDVDAPVFVNIPANFSVDVGYTGLNVSWTAIDLNPTTYTIELDGIENVSATEWIGGISIVYDIPNGLSKGEYSITIILLEINGKTAQQTVIFTVGSSFTVPGFPLMTILFSMSVGVLMLRRKLNH